MQKKKERDKDGEVCDDYIDDENGTADAFHCGNLINNKTHLLYSLLSVMLLNMCNFLNT